MAQSLQVKNVNHRHEGIADWLLANPHRKLGECAEEMQLTRTHLSVVINSDAFKVYYNRRRATLNDFQAQRAIQSLYEIATRSAKVVAEELEKADCSATFALDANTKALKSLGYGTNGNVTINATQNTQQNNFGAVDKATLTRARGRLMESGANDAISEDTGQPDESEVLPQPAELCTEAAETLGSPSQGEELREESIEVVTGDSGASLSSLAVDLLLLREGSEEPVVST
jgi:hypothetical protein